ncbi:MAG: cytochrome c3 family protein [Rhodothermales bacterium]|nr:cytochrome c3 family protein [Rhodothermales bacterium]
MPRYTPFLTGMLATCAVLMAGCLSSGQESSVSADTTHVVAPAAEIVFPPEPVFDHEFHIDDVELECTECHHEADAAALTTPHEEYFEDLWITCSSCHRGEEDAVGPQACVECHPRTPIGIADQTVSAKVATHLSCWECHDSGTGVEASENCSFCHQE